MNCNSAESQTFVCIPGSHVPESIGSDGSTGFGQLTKQEMKGLKENQVSVTIPPGHGMYFIQDTIHCVHAKALPYDMRRVYLAIRITTSDCAVPLISNIEEILVNGDVVPLKSGQIPPMYPKLWAVNWQDKLINFSEKFSKSHPEMVEHRFIGGKRLRERRDTPNEGEYPIVKRYAPSVLPKMPYTEEEIALHLPHSINDALQEQDRHKEHLVDHGKSSTVE